MIEGVIVKGIGGFYYVSTKKDGVFECRARGKFRKKGIKPMVGDRVVISAVDMTAKTAAIEEIGDRQSYLVRPPVANIECVVIVVAATSPQPDFFMIDKLAVTAKKSGIKVVIAVNKTDLGNAEEIVKIYKDTGYDVALVCAKTGDGVDALRGIIKGKVTAFAGNSGVGKSSLLNRFGLDLQTGDVSKIERGKHTTRHVELFDIGDATYVMDTPGFSILEISDIDCHELKDFFGEFSPYEDKCRFSGCDHYGTRPRDCAVAEAVQNGNIAKTRYESYTQLYSVLKEVKKWEK